MTLDSTILEFYKLASKPNYAAISNKLLLVEGTTSTAIGLTSLLIGIEEPNTMLACIGTVYTGFGAYILAKPDEAIKTTIPYINKSLRPILLTVSSLAISSALILEKIVLDYSHLLPTWTYTAPLLFASFAANIFTATSRTYLKELQLKELPQKESHQQK